MVRVSKNITLVVATALLALAMIVSGCCGILNGNSNGSNGPGGSTPAQQAVHGTISSGTPAVDAQGTFISMGGTITVNKPDSPINGLTIEAPAGAYQTSQPVKVSSAPITGNTFGQYFNPVSPLITIDAGTGYADQPILVTIPINITPDQFPMAFYYNKTDQKLEGIPTVKYDTHSITIVTRHFCDIVVSAILNGTLDAVPVADAGFKPGKDDWEFENWGSYIEPNGHCAGQSLSMMWYYTEQRQKLNAPQLNGRFDDNGRAKTPDVMRDDTEGYRFASVVHADKGANFASYDIIRPYFTGLNDSITFYLFKYSILMTGEPQFIRLVNSSGAHAIVCYKVAGNTMYVADPNFPGKERTIQINGNKFAPYSSGDNSEDIKANGATLYKGIYYIAKTALINYDVIAADYAQMQAGTVGDGKFPKYGLNITMKLANGSIQKIDYNDAGRNLGVERIVVNSNKINYIRASDDSPAGLYRVEATYKGTTHATMDNSWPILLDKGSNVIAVEMFSSPNQNVDLAWLGFDYIDFYYQPDASPTPTPTAAAGNERKPDRGLPDVTVPQAPYPVQSSETTNPDGSRHIYSYYKDPSNNRQVSWGSDKSYYANGKLKSESTRLDTKTVGHTRSYVEDGTLIYEQYRDSNGVLKYQDYYASNGKMRQAIDYWDNGKERDRFDYGDYGGPLQTYYEYDSAGTLKLKETWSNGRLTSSTPQ